MAEFDFANPPVSRITADLKGVAILLWGSNGTGKTPIACGMDKPYYLGFEAGLTGIEGVPYYPVTNWKDFLKFVNWATKPATTEVAHQAAQTIILDTVDVMADYCIDYTCMKLGIQSLGETRYTTDGKRDGSVNAYTEYAREFKRATRALRTAGFTLVYIAHDGGYREEIDTKTQQKYNKLYPSGDRRAIEPICNDVDVIGYVQASPLDEDGRPTYSNVYFAPNNLYHTRSRYAEIVPYVQHVTAKSLTAAIVEAKQKELERTGGKAATFEEQTGQTYATTLSYDELKDKIRQHAERLIPAGRQADYVKIVESYLGKGKGAMDATLEQKPLLELILDELNALS